MTDPYAYTITVRRRNIDDEALFEAVVAELPDLSGYGETYQEAYDFVIDLIEELCADALIDGRPFPKPRPENDVEYSGRLTLRLTKRVHRLAAEAAELEGVSLNAYLAMAIAEHVAAENSQRDFYSAVRNVVSNLATQSSPKAAIMPGANWLEGQPTAAALGRIPLVLGQYPAIEEGHYASESGLLGGSAGMGISGKCYWAEEN